jgi:hypothetical protein
VLRVEESERGNEAIDGDNYEWDAVLRANLVKLQKSRLDQVASNDESKLLEKLGLIVDEVNRVLQMKHAQRRGQVEKDFHSNFFGTANRTLSTTSAEATSSLSS